MAQDVLKEEYIIFDLEASSKEDCLKQLAKEAFRLGISRDAEETYQDYIDREKEVSTGFTDGFAIPHAKSEAINHPAILVAKLKNAVDWQSMDELPAEIIISLNIPKENEGSMHIQLLSKLSRKVMKADFRESVKNTQSALELFEIISQVLNED